ncbi:MAG: endonuclease/exonuclease/phosphatase family protein [Gammaproteobacteria bacterium]|nr:endonuclease/exonuclease/phosphatase family protein [Gammaproteobacteria bacterium]
MNTIKVLTLNTWLKEGPYETREPLIKDWIRVLEPDLIGFQEVLDDQVGGLLDQFGYFHQWHFGMSIASRWKISNFTSINLPGVNEGEIAGPVIAGHIDSPFGTIPFINATTFHFMPHEGWKRRKQMPTLNTFVRSVRIKEGYPVIMVGDFNTDPDSDEIRYLMGLHSIEDTSAYFCDAWERAGDEGTGATWAQENHYSRTYGSPDRRIDYIFVGAQGIQGAGAIKDCRVVCNKSLDDVWPSDHFGVFAELTVE